MEVLAKRGSKNIVKVAITIGEESVLYELNQQESLENIISSVCRERNIPGNPKQYSFQLEESNHKNEIQRRYITEDNRSKIQNGHILKLVLSPEEMVKIIISKIGYDSDPDDETRSWHFEKLASFSSDPTFSKAFLKADGLSVLTSLLLNNALEEVYLCNCLHCLYCVLKFQLITTLDVKIIEKMCKIIVESQYKSSVIADALLIVEKIVRLEAFKNKREMIYKSLNVDHLIRHIQNNNSDEVQENAVGLLNALAENSKDARITEIMAAEYRHIIYASVLKLGRNVSISLGKKLYTYQKLILNLLVHELHSTVDQNGADSSAIQEIQAISERTFEKENSIMGNDYKLKKKRMKKKQNLEKLLQIPNNMSHLTLSCMVFFSQRYPESFSQVMLTENKVGNSFYVTCDYVLRLLCKIVGIGGQAMMERKYQPLVFSVPMESPFLNELFCRALLRLTKTRREMRAKTIDDHKKVLLVLERQIIEGLKTQPREWQKLDRQLQEWSYERVTQVWNDEREQQLQWNLRNLPPVVSLRETRTNELLDVIAQQRLGVMSDGEFFPKLGVRQQKGKQKLWFAYLSPNHKVIHYGDCIDENRPECPCKISVSDIRDLVTGLKCPHIKNAKPNQRLEASFAFSITYEEDDQPKSLDFIAPSCEVYDHWTDGISVLLGRSMKSKKLKSDLDTLLDMDIRLQLMDLEGIHIPHSPPPIPDDPPDFDFSDPFVSEAIK
ncbi:engulfment and cell motility protein 1-like [Schistocerca serialis cubense]|uniref:engulfment and cell motility protein 1-like n=1 Tax=Schistocerca serialis cubense TaxID=2023355 RepID=UPI00214F0500|nr:engulfment and cell motility protein 1-like [Schistocerca serialis cubense]